MFATVLSGNSGCAPFTRTWRVSPECRSFRANRGVPLRRQIIVNAPRNPMPSRKMKIWPGVKMSGTNDILGCNTRHEEEDLEGGPPWDSRNQTSFTQPAQLFVYQLSRYESGPARTGGRPYYEVLW